MSTKIVAFLVEKEGNNVRKGENALFFFCQIIIANHQLNIFGIKLTRSVFCKYYVTFLT